MHIVYRQAPRGGPPGPGLIPTHPSRELPLSLFIFKLYLHFTLKKKSLVIYLVLISISIVVVKKERLEERGETKQGE